MKCTLLNLLCLILAISLTLNIKLENHKIQKNYLEKPKYMFPPCVRDIEKELIEQREKLNNKGHYEKIIKTTEKYIFVSGDKPSGLPGAFVVSDINSLNYN